MVKHAWKVAVAGMTLAILLIPFALEANEKRGEWLRIEKVDGGMVEGELLKVSGETLFLFDRDIQRGSQVNLGEVRQLGIRRRTDVLGGMGIGLLAGLAAGLVVGNIGAKLFWSKHSDEGVGFYMICINTFVLGGIVTGLATNGFQGHFQKRQALNLKEEGRLALITELKNLSREAKNYYPEIMR